MNSRVLGSVIGIFGCGIVLYAVMMKQGKCLYNKEYWNYGLKVSVPSVLSSISYMIMFNLDNVMVTRFNGSSAAATYMFVYYIGYILYAILQATNSTLQAWLYRLLDSGNTTSAKTVQKWYLLIFDIFEYVGPFVIGSYLMVMYSFYSIVGEFHKKNMILSIYVCIAAVVNTILNYLFIPIFGCIAASLTTVFAYMLLFILMRSLSQKLNKNLFSDKLFILSFALVVLSAIVYELIYSMILTRYIIFSLTLLLIIIYSFINRSEWSEIIKKKAG